jgi:hypothetical protein
MNTARLAWVILALPLFLGTSLFSQEQGEVRFDIVRGTWTITSKNIEDDEWVTKYVEINQNRTQLSGHFQGPNQQGGIEGSILNHHIVFHTRTKNVLTFRGEVDGDTMSGTYSFRGREAPFKAVRTNPPPAR